MKPIILAVGNSQIGPFIRGHQSLRAKGQLACDVHGLTFEAARYEPEYLFEKDGIQFNPTRIEDSLEAIREKQPIAVVSTVVGSHHWIAGLIHNPRPYDFLVPSLPEHRKSPGTELIPYDLVVTRVRGDLDWQFGLVQAMRDFCDLPIFIVEAPPPVQSADMMLRSLFGHFQAAMEEFGCPSVSFRYKVWWLISDVAKQLCAERGFRFIEGPRETRDQQGFLKECYYLDGVHGNDAYGELMAREVARVMQTTALAEA